MILNLLSCYANFASKDKKIRNKNQIHYKYDIYNIKFSSILRTFTKNNILHLNIEIEI